MRRRLTMLALTVALLLLAVACQGADTASEDDTTSAATADAPADEGTEPGNTEAASSTEDAASDEPIRIGAILDVTGAGASLAEQQVNALELLAQQVNDGGGVDGRPVELEIIDNQSAEAEAATAMTRLANEGFDLVIGASRTGPSMAMRQIAIDEELPMISLAAGDAITADAPCVFKTTKGTSAIVDKLVQWYEIQGFETVALLRDASGFGEGVDALVEDAGSVELVFDERFAPEETDFTPPLVNLRGSGADVTLAWGIGSPPNLITNTYRELGLEPQLTLPTTSPAYLQETGEAANGVVFAGEKMFVYDELPPDDPQYDVIQQFVEDYRAEYDRVPDHFAGAAHDAFMQAIEAFAAVGTDTAAVCDHLEGLSDWVGVNGVYNRSPEDHVGLGPDDLVIVEVVAGDDPFDRWTLAEQQPE